MNFKDEAERLKKSAWPVCDKLAADLTTRGPAAIPALEYAVSSRTHHVRSARLRSINALDEAKGKEWATKMLADRAYEVRETAANILGVPPR